MRSRVLVLAWIAILATTWACAGVDQPSGSSVTASSDGPTDPVGAVSPAVAARSEALVEVARAYEAAWDAGDLDAIEALLSDGEFLFTEPGRRIESRQGFMDLMAPFLDDPGQVGARDRRFHVGDDEVIESYRTWGFGGATEDDPLVEVDLFTVRGDEIASIVAMYGADLLARHLSLDPTALLRDYVTAWSSGDIRQIGSLYADDATRTEPLFDIHLQGTDAIVQDAAAFIERHPGTSLAVVDPYVFGDETHAGAVLSLVDDSGCAIDRTVVLETDGDNRITSERVYDDLAAITGCDWVR